jgi:amidase
MPRREQWHGLAVLGCLTRTVLDSALFLDVARGGAPGDAVVAPAPKEPFVEAARTAPGKLRVAVSMRPFIPARVEEDVRRAVRETAELLRALGHHVEERDPDYGLIGSSFVPRFLRGIHDDAAGMESPERLERRTRGLARIGHLVSPAVVRRARAAEAAHAERINRLFERHDVLLTPVAARLPVELGRWEGLGPLRTLVGMGLAYPFTSAWNTTGQPAAAVPAGFSADRLPLSVQLVGRPNDEATLLSLAAQLEAERPWADRRPPVS